MWKLKNSSFFRFGLTEIRQEHNSYLFPLEEDLEPQSRAAKTKESQGTSQQLLNMHLQPHAVSLAETAWEGRQWSYPQVTLKNEFHLARRACHWGHDSYSSQWTQGWHIHNSSAQLQSLGGNRGGISAAVQKNSLFCSASIITTVGEVKGASQSLNPLHCTQ